MRCCHLLAVCFVVVGALPASAQGRLSADFSAGWAPIFETKFDDHNLPGWYGAVNVGLNRFTGFAFDVSGWYVGYTISGDRGYGSGHTFVGGPRFTLASTDRARIFAHVLVGAIRLADGAGYSQSGFVVQPGAGVDVATARSGPFAVRAQVDLPSKLLTGDYGNRYWSRYWRISAGVAYRLRQ